MAFSIATAETGGAKGPFLSWSSNGSAQKGFPPKSWYIRDKDEAGNRTETVVPAFEKGCVMDLDSLKLGWQRDGGQGNAPEKQWSPHFSQPMAKPGDEWSAALSIRCAIGGGAAATWEQASFGAYDAFSSLSTQIEAQWAEHSANGVKLPLVKQTGVITQTLKSGSSNKPVLEIVEWVDRPDCLKDDAPAIATTPTPAPAPAPEPAGATEPF